MRTGEPWEIKSAVCLHEEDAGILWKHMEYRNGHSEVRRSRRLVLSFVATVVNYECAQTRRPLTSPGPARGGAALCVRVCNQMRFMAP